MRDERSIKSSARLASECRDTLLDVLASQGVEAGQYTVLSPDPWRVIFSASGEGFINFLEHAHAVVSWRSPVASESESDELVGALYDYARQRRKALFLVEVNERARDAGGRRTMTPLWTGAECFLDLSKWSIAGGRRQKVRWARSHAQRLGVTWREATPLTSRDDDVALARVEAAWKNERPQRRTDSFLRTSYLEIADQRRYFVGEQAGEVLASVTCSPINAKGWYLQDIVRVPHAPRGALEGAMAFALDVLRDEGYAVASNGPLPFWRPHESWDDEYQFGPLGNRLMKLFDRQFRFGGINQFRSKFEPDWTEPLYVLRSQRFITPWVARSLTQLLNHPPRPVRSSWSSRSR
ncbi:MAG TPA: phosphatidylglycerol lysyltransferase domain-containing protein [Acidimicrobiales bacterium]|nr:phosphatidylglycerol lysyltransferase domain-containing protein [Acidimicrobiales bacterium]